MKGFEVLFLLIVLVKDLVIIEMVLLDEVNIFNFNFFILLVEVDKKIE